MFSRIESPEFNNSHHSFDVISQNTSYKRMSFLSRVILNKSKLNVEMPLYTS